MNDYLKSKKKVTPYRRKIISFIIAALIAASIGLTANIPLIATSTLLTASIGSLIFASTTIFALMGLLIFLGYTFNKIQNKNLKRFLTGLVIVVGALFALSVSASILGFIVSDIAVKGQVYALLFALPKAFLAGMTFSHSFRTCCCWTYYWSSRGSYFPLGSSYYPIS